MPSRLLSLCLLSFLCLVILSYAQHIDVNPAIHAATIGAGPVPEMRPKPAEDPHPELHRPEPTPAEGGENPPEEGEHPQEAGETPPNEEATSIEEAPPKESHNPWTYPPPDFPAEELEAGHLYNFTWSPNTEGPISLELWKIEESVPKPKFLLASDIDNTGIWSWNIHVNFPHGTGYTIVIVPASDRNLASLSPFFTIIGDVDYESILPPPAPQKDPHAGVNWSEIEVNHDGNAWKMAYAIAGGFLACNAFLFLASWARTGRGTFLGLRARGYEMLEKETGRKRVFHARSISARV